MTDEQIILKDMRDRRCPHNSWDWEADYHFAKAVGAHDEIEILSALLKSAAVAPIQVGVHKRFIIKLKNRRLRALRRLEKQGLVESFWLGTGLGGYAEFGVTRVKTWRLKTR